MAGNGSDFIRIDMKQLERATLQEQAKQFRKVPRGQTGYITYIPQVRTTKQGRQARKRGRRKASATQWRVKVLARTRQIRVWNLTAVGTLNEFRPEIRGYQNRHYRAMLRSLEANWRLMSLRAMSAAPKRVRTNQIRKIKAQQARGR